MSKCPNCGTTMSCGCQRRSLPNGKPGCSKCVNNSTPSTPPAKSATRYTNLKNDSDNVNPEINSASLSKK